ncbi:MAG: hypothetical protein ACXVCY_15170 [Pseudobdellovibrionaceae bacterium]
MDFSDKKLEIGIAGFSALVLLGMGYLLKAPVQAVLGGSDQDIVYEMPRPKKSFFDALFDLGDRDIERKYVNPFAKKKAKEEKKATGTVKIGTPAAPKNVAQQKQDNKKTEPQKNKVDVKVVGEDTAKKLSDDGFWNTSNKNAHQNQVSDTAVAQQDNKDGKNTLDGNQWRALLMAQPTKDNVDKMIAAYSNKEIDDQTFYSIVIDLFRSNKPEVQGYGLMAVESAYNVKSFSVTAQYYDQLAPEVQKKAHAYLLSYGVSGRLPILLGAIQSQDVVVVNAAAQVVMDGYKKAKGGVSIAADPRASRGDVTVNTVSSYSKFVPVLQQLAHSHDASIANIATSVLNEIQSTVAAL